MVAPNRDKNRWYDSPVKSKAGVKTHHFFVTSMDWEFLSNKQGEILIFLSRDQAQAFAKTCECLQPGFQVVGMGDEKWELFQKTETWTLMEGK